MSDYRVEGEVSAEVSSAIINLDKVMQKFNDLDNHINQVIHDMERLDEMKATPSVSIKEDGVAEDIRRVKDDLEEVDGKKAEAKVEVDGLTSVLVKLETAKSALDEYGAHVRNAVIDIKEATGFRAKLAAIKGLLNTVDDIAIKVSGVEKAKAKIEELKLRLDEMRAYHANAVIDVKEATGFKEKILAIRAMLATIRNKTVKVDVDESGISKLTRDAGEAERAIGGGAGGGGGGLIGAIALLAPALAPIAGVAAGGIGAIAASAGVAATGIGALAVFAIGSIKSVATTIKELQKAKDAVANATTPEQLNAALAKQKALLDSISPAVLKVVKHFYALQDEWSKLSDKLQPQVFSILGKGLDFLSTMLHILFPIAKAAAGAVSGLMDSLNKSTGASDVAHDFYVLAKNVGSFITVWGKSVGNFVVGIMNMLAAFTPLAKDFNGGMLKMSERFRHWTAGLEHNEGFQKFVSYVRKETPAVLHFLGRLVTLVVDLGKAFAPMGDKVLSVVNGLADGLHHLMESDPGVAKFAATLGAIGVAAITIGPQIMGLVQAIGPLIEVLAVPEVAIPALAAAFIALSVAVSGAKDKSNFFKELKGLWSDLKKLAGDLAHALKPLWDFFKAHIAPNITILMTNVIKVFRQLLPIIKPLAELLGLVLVASLTALSYSLRYLSDAVVGVFKVIGPIIHFIVDLFQWLYDKLVGHSIIPDLIHGILHWFNFLHNIKEIVHAALTAALTKIVEWVGKALNWFERFKDGVSSKLAKVIAYLVALPGRILHAIGHLGHLLWDTGTAILQGLWNGLKDKWEDVKGWFSDKMSWIKEHANWHLGIGSPSKVFHNIGKWVMEGLVNGLQSKDTELDHALRRVTDKIRGTEIPSLEIGIAGALHGRVRGGDGAVALGHPQTPPKNGGGSTRIGVYVAPGGMPISVGAGADGKKVGKAISDKLTRVAKFGAFDNGGPI